MNKSLFLLALTALLAVSCGNRQKTSEPMADSGRTQRTENLLSSLKKIASQDTYMFGHHDATVYGIGWKADYENDSTVGARSDVMSVCGDLPAVLSFDLGGIELTDERNLDKVKFDRLRKEIVQHFERGGMTTLSWHVNNPVSGGNAWIKDSLRDVETKTVEAVLEGGAQHEKYLGWIDKVADFLNSLETPYGVKAPVVFRPYHEHTGSWFWWGQDNCTPEQYKALWKMTVGRLKERGVVNALYAYSPGTEPNGDPEKYLERYPGDDVIDVLGFDTYCNAPGGDPAGVAAYIEKAHKGLGMIASIAKQHDKAMALTETGYEGIQTDDWWTQTLAQVLAKHPVSYVVMWRNAHDKQGHFYAPYPGHSSASDFVKFYNLKETLFLKDVNGLYLEK